MANLLCEGACSPHRVNSIGKDRIDWSSIAGTDAMTRNRLLTESLRYQPHAFVREVLTKQPDKSRQFWTCVTCGHERVWG
jgi:hypothetical protein